MSDDYSRYIPSDDDTVSPLEPAAKKILGRAMEQIVDNLEDDDDLQVPAPSKAAKRISKEVEQAKEKILHSYTREQAIEIGRNYGEDTSRRAGEIGNDRDLRIRRAQAYAAWEYDGKPKNVWPKYQKEFGLKDAAVSQAQRHSGPDLRPLDKKR